MSPRSEEMLAEARARLRAARANLEIQEWAVATSAGYYALLYAARAALSERDLKAKTHIGTWNLLWEHFVDPGDLDRDLAAAARATQEIRELGDYEARPPTEQQARETAALAERLIEAVAELYAD